MHCRLTLLLTPHIDIIPNHESKNLQSFRVYSAHLFKVIMAIKYSDYNFRSCGDVFVTNWLLSLRQITVFCKS